MVWSRVGTSVPSTISTVPPAGAVRGPFLPPYTRPMGRAEPSKCPHRACSALPPVSGPVAVPPAPADAAPGTGRTALHGHG